MVIYIGRFNDHVCFSLWWCPTIKLLGGNMVIDVGRFIDQVRQAMLVSTAPTWDGATIPRSG